MPELPEVETVVRDLRPLLVGRKITAIEVGRLALRRRWQSTWHEHILDRRIVAVQRRGKWILVDLAGPWLLVHLGMTGQFTVERADQPRRNHTHLIFALEDANELRFRDVRRFGSATLFPDQAALDAYFAKQNLGPEPFELESKYWLECLARTRRNLKAILLDQTILAGVGNIYADESLFEAKLHPTLLGNALTSSQARRLQRAIVAVLTRAIEKRGSSIKDYIGGSGLMGQYQGEFRVYGRTDEPCRRCRTPIQRIRLAGRSTHFCSQCQRG